LLKHLISKEVVVVVVVEIAVNEISH